MQSIHNKRLWNQLDNMDRAYPNNYLVLHGSFYQVFREFIGYTKGTNTRNMRTMMKRKYLASIGRILLDLDCTLIECKDSRQAAERICLMCKMQPHERAVYSPSMIRKKKIRLRNYQKSMQKRLAGTFLAKTANNIKNAAFTIGRAIALRGLTRTQFFTKAYDKNYKVYVNKITQAYAEYLAIDVSDKIK